MEFVEMSVSSNPPKHRIVNYLKNFEAALNKVQINSIKSFEISAKVKIYVPSFHRTWQKNFLEI